MIKCRLVYILSFLFLASSCKDTQIVEDEASATAVQSIEQQVTEVKSTSATKSTFIVQKILNGKIEADKKTIVKAEASGLTTYYGLVEGKYISQGDPLINLDDRDATILLEQRKNELEKATLDINQRIVADGGEYGDSTSITLEKLKIFKIMSGYNSAQTELKTARLNLSRKTISAPVSGWIADIKSNQGEFISNGQEICTIIDPSSFEVKIDMLENDVLNLPIGTTITAYPLLSPTKTIKAKITKINPVVDKNGLVTVYARITSKKKNLYEGMNMRIEIETKINNQIIVPKSALVSRSGRDVIFIQDKDSNLAKWKYVTVAYENKTSLAISEGIEEGDQVIYEGNLNLDHDAKVKSGD